MGHRCVRSRLPSLPLLLLAVAVAFAPSPARAEGDAPLRREVEAYLADAEPGDHRAAGIYSCLAAAGDEEPSPWAFTAAIYLWAPAIKGDITAEGSSTTIDVPFSELFDDLTGAFMGTFGARKGRWGILLDVIWSDFEDSSTGPLGGTIDAEMEMFIATLTGSYTVLQRGEEPKGLFVLDAYAGARFYSAEIELTTTLSSPGQGETWVDPIVGLDARYRTHKWLFLARADIGGFEISSELAWSVTLGIAFQCSDLISLAAGYRWLGVDFETGGTGFTDVEFAGPFFALVFTW